MLLHISYRVEEDQIISFKTSGASELKKSEVDHMVIRHQFDWIEISRSEKGWNQGPMIFKSSE